MIAFDFDGIFVQDIEVDKYRECLYLDKVSVETFRHYFTKSMFKPTFKYSIITGRNKKYEDVTMDWINKNLPNIPSYVFHNCDNSDHGVYYKEKILKENYNLFHAYVESDLDQSIYLQNSLKGYNIKVIHFESWLMHCFTCSLGVVL